MYIHATENKILTLRNDMQHIKASFYFMGTFEYFFVQISVQVWLKAELKIACCSDKIKIPFQILFYPFRCMFKIMKGYKIFDFTPSGKSLKKTLV